MKNKRRGGFTFIEIMAVMIILGILATLIMPKIFGRIEDSKVIAAKVQIKSFEQALQLFYLDNNCYPTTEQGLNALVQVPVSSPIPEHWRQGGYLESQTVSPDPWGHPYVYLSPGSHGEDFEIISYGKNGQEGGTSAISSSDIMNSDSGVTQ